MPYYFVSAVLVAIDQVVKLWVRNHVAVGEYLVLIPGVLDLTHTRNTGAAFSSFSNMTGLLTIVSLAASVFLGMVIAKRLFADSFGLFSISLLLAGAVGNLIDRALLGSVTDMLSLGFMDFAIFNVADVCVTTGAILLGIRVFFLEKFEEEEENGPRDADG